jgi:hypothetical protein
MYDVESSFSESVVTVVSHLARMLSRRGIEDASCLCLCFGPAQCRRCAVDNRSLHGGGTAQARRHGASTVQTRDRRIIERPNQKVKSELKTCQSHGCNYYAMRCGPPGFPPKDLWMRIRVMDEKVTLWMKQP